MHHQNARRPHQTELPPPLRKKPAPALTSTDDHMIRVILPHHLRTLAGVGREVTVNVRDAVTPRSILDALESQYPVLAGTIRDHVTHQRRPLVRFFACQEDFSQESPDIALPEAVASGAEPFYIIGAIAGG